MDTPETANVAKWAKLVCLLILLKNYSKKINERINEGNFVLIAAGENHNVYVSDEGRVYSSGNHLHGQLGCGDEEQKSET